MKAQKQTILLAGGGTGGHVFPLLAVAQALRQLRPELELVFVGTRRGMEAKLLPERGERLEFLPVLPLRGGGWRGLLKGLGAVCASGPASFRLLQQTRARAVLSAGGYAAGPISWAAQALGLPLGVLEPNSVAGFTNLVLALSCERAYLAFPEVESHFAPSRLRAYGVPLRSGFEPRPYQSPHEAQPLRILVLGGSQGAAALNQVLPKLLAQVERPLDIVHQCGEAHREQVEAAYASHGLVSESAISQARVSGSHKLRIAPFISDMLAELERAQLVISRSGASASSEIAAVGRPALLIPFPFASGDHQKTNAMSLASRGAAECVCQGVDFEARLGLALQSLLTSPRRLSQMALAASKAGRPQAALDIARDFLSLCEDHH